MSCDFASDGDVDLPGNLGFDPGDQVVHTNISNRLQLFIDLVEQFFIALLDFFFLSRGLNFNFKYN